MVNVYLIILMSTFMNVFGPLKVCVCPDFLTFVYCILDVEKSIWSSKIECNECHYLDQQQQVHT